MQISATYPVYIDRVSGVLAQCLDEIIMFDWTPYDGVEHWGRVQAAGGEDDTEDQMYLPFTQTDCWIIG